MTPLGVKGEAGQPVLIDRPVDFQRHHDLLPVPGRNVERQLHELVDAEPAMQLGSQVGADPSRVHHVRIRIPQCRLMLGSEGGGVVARDPRGELVVGNGLPGNCQA